MNRKALRYIAIIAFAWLSYLFSYLGRVDYSSCIASIVEELNVSRAAAGIVSSVFALCNAIGQVVIATQIRRVSPLILVTVELVSVGAINLAFPFVSALAPTVAIPLMALLWGVNGALQATLLCSMIRIFSETLPEPWLSRGTLLMNTIGAVGGAVNYVLTAALLSAFGWKSVFFSTGGTLAVFTVLFLVFMPRLTRQKLPSPPKAQTEATPEATPEKASPSVFRLLLSHAAPCAVLGAFFVGGLRESVLLWVPSYMNEQFSLSHDVSAAVTAVVPLLQLLGVFIGGTVGARSKNLFFPTLAAFSVSVASFLLLATAALPPAVSIALFVLNAVSMTAALTFLLTYFPLRNFSREHLATVTGFLNFAVHLGDFVSSTGVGWLSENAGWQSSFLAMAAFACLAGVTSLIGAHRSKKRQNTNETLQN